MSPETQPRNELSALRDPTAGRRNEAPAEFPAGLPRAGSRRPRVLVLDEEVPIPANSGKPIRTLNLLTRLAAAFEIHLLVHSSGAHPEGAAELARRGIAVHVAPSRVSRNWGIRFFLRLLANLASPLPYTVQSHVRSGYRAAFRRLVGELAPDIVHCEWTPYAAYLPAAPVRPAVVAAHNIEHRIWERRAEADPSACRRAFVRIQARRMRRFEAAVFARVGRATAVSEGDAQTIRALGCTDVTVVPNGVDTEYFLPRPQEPVDPRSLVFTGSMDWFANQDAIRWFVDDVKPLDPALSSAKLLVVGRSPPAWLVTLAGSRDDMVVTGNVPDVRPFVARAAAYVVPLRVGGGSRIKILEALAMGKAVVSTRVGAEGLDVTDGEDIVLADSARDFADATLRVLRAPLEAGKLGAAGRALVEARYDWSRIAPVQECVWWQSVSEAAGSDPHASSARPLAIVPAPSPNRCAES